jgi:uncharacterized iron-regulated membrane protein
MSIAIPAAPSPLYRAIWRWHFYAGLMVLPFMILLAVTGGVYLFKDELNRVLYADYLVVEPQAEAPLSPADIKASALAVLPGLATSYLPPDAADASAVVTIKGAAGKQRVYLDPYSGTVLGILEDGGAARSPLMLLIRKIHSLDYFGWIANRVIELVAGWAIVLVVSGIYLWWPRNKGVGVFKIRSGAARRPFWRDLHAVTGLYTGAFIVFLSITGLPWSGFWGDKVNTYVNAAGIGYPTGYWENIPVSTVPMKEAMTEVNWTMENAPLPKSTPTGEPAFSLTRAVATFDQLGIAKGYAVDLPQDPEAVYTASVYPDNIAEERIIHLDQYSGKTLFDAGFKDLGDGGKAIEWGVSVHMGQEYGLINQLVMAGACLAIVAMCVSATIMWWQRRPKGSLGAPRYPSDYRVARSAIIILIILGVTFPLVGLSMIVALAIDFLLPRTEKILNA